MPSTRYYLKRKQGQSYCFLWKGRRLDSCYQCVPPIPHVLRAAGGAAERGAADAGYREAGGIYRKAPGLNDLRRLIQREEGGWAQQAGQIAENKCRAIHYKKDV